jgi:hypothetical protein
MEFDSLYVKNMKANLCFIILKTVLLKRSTFRNKSSIHRNMFYEIKMIKLIKSFGDQNK